VRLRALPVEHGNHYQQALIDHFFIDIEDRIRTVLQPPPKPSQPYTFETSFYSNPNAPTNSTTPDGKPNRLSRAPDRIVTQQMKIFKEQWAGMGLSFDLGLVKGDMELAGAVWRNLLGARGAQGIAYGDTSSSSTPHFRRSVNLVGGEVINVAKVDIEKEEAKDDGSGVHDFSPEEVDKYLTYPEVMVDVVAYLRRELARLDKISDEDIVHGDWTKLTFGRVR
jgi:cytochrome b pre-mRNA-processing protein 3